MWCVTPPFHRLVKDAISSGSLESVYSCPLVNHTSDNIVIQDSSHISFNTVSKIVYSISSSSKQIWENWPFFNKRDMKYKLLNLASTTVFLWLKHTRSINFSSSEWHVLFRVCVLFKEVRYLFYKSCNSNCFRNSLPSDRKGKYFFWQEK